MLKVTEEVDVSRAVPLTDWSQREWDTNDGKTLIRRSRWVRSLTQDDRILLIAGVKRDTLTAIPELWLIMSQGFCKNLRRNVKYVRLLLDELVVEYPRLEVRVDKSFEAGMKFARFMGFKEIGEYPAGFALFEVRQ